MTTCDLSIKFKASCARERKLNVHRNDNLKSHEIRKDNKGDYNLPTITTLKMALEQTLFYCFVKYFKLNK
jgi:hypothetical protein